MLEFFGVVIIAWGERIDYKREHKENAVSSFCVSSIISRLMIGESVPIRININLSFTRRRLSIIILSNISMNCRCLLCRIVPLVLIIISVICFLQK